jgi:uncharacterized protein YbjT (DUF2867 family)
MSIVAIAGATGYIGGRIAPRLLEAGYQVRCLVRSVRKIRDRDWAANPLLELEQVDLADSAAVAKALNGCESAFYLVHSMMSAGAGYADKDRELAKSFSKGAQLAGVKRIIYLGGLGSSNEDLSKHLASRREVEEALASAGVPVTVLRAAMIIGSGSASFEILRYLVERLPVMITPKWVSTLCQPIGVRNVVGYLLGVLNKPETIGQTYEIGGPDVMSYLDIMRVMAEEAGLKKRIIIPVPVFTPKLSSYWIHLVTPLSKDIAKPLAEGLRNPVICNDHRLAQIIPQELLSVRAAIRAALQKIAHADVETSWSMAGPIPGDPDWAGGTVFQDIREVEIAAPDWAVFRAVCRVGGGHGWYAADWLWRIRGWMDVMVGGPGLRRGRRDPELVGYGEALDFWRVTGYERDCKLALRAEMKLPGEALLEFLVLQQSGNKCVLKQEALFLPRGLFGILYWYSVVPFHAIVFKGMLKGIENEAMQIAASASVPAV